MTSEERAGLQDRIITLQAEIERLDREILSKSNARHINRKLAHRRSLEAGIEIARIERRLGACPAPGARQTVSAISTIGNYV